MHGEGWLDDALDTVSSAVSKGKDMFETGKKMYDKYAPLVKKGKKMYDTYAPVAKKMYKKARGGIQTGGIETGGISTGGLSRKLLGARAVGGKMHGGNWFEDGLQSHSGTHMMLGVGKKGEMQGEGWFDDALGSVVNAVSTLHPIYKDFKKGRGKRGGISTGGAKKPSKWIQHVKQYANKHNVSYKQAMKDAKASYH